MAAAKELSPTVNIAGDKTKATLRVPPGCDGSVLTEQILIGLISAEGVEVTEHTNTVIRSFIQDLPPLDKEVILEVAFATPVEHGADGSVEWCIKECPVEENEAPAPADSSEADNISYYEQSSFLMVHAGDVIGKIRAAGTGHDGRDVTGATIPAKSGKEVQLTLDESIMKRADGSLVAQQDGVLYRETNKAQIRKYIEIHEYVDFSTGNIDFDGDIMIGRGVRDCFEVKATGNIEVKGLIEAATIIADKDLIAAGGFAGRERGHVHIGGCLRGKYLDNVYGHVKHDLCIDREVINCELEVEGSISSRRGSIIGGTVTPTGEIEINTLGSGAGVTTEVVVGSVPILEPFARAFDQIVEQLTHDMDKLTEEQNIINQNSGKGRMTAMDKERQTEILFEQSSVGSCLDKARRTLDRVQEEIRKRRRVEVLVHDMVFPGVTFLLDERRYKIAEELKGPVRFFVKGKDFVYRQGEAPAQLVSTIADVRAVLPGREAA